MSSNVSLPEVFRLTISSFYGRSFTLLLRDGKLLYHSTRPTEEITRDPSGEDWDRFWKETVRLKIWVWKKEYVDKSSSDGASWSINIEVGKLKLRSYGSNIRPDNFEEFLESVRKLVPGLQIILN
ncbi:MAG: hypothetical protein JXN63_08635 [Candidatus Delongbacteria bacterium]|nr:hypothetical protein [Candidatus Delongbacteria bacterium]